jgi:hypothetical protein
MPVPSHLGQERLLLFFYNLDLGGATLAWASAQPVATIRSSDGLLHVFMPSERHCE